MYKLVFEFGNHKSMEAEYCPTLEALKNIGQVYDAEFSKVPESCLQIAIYKNNKPFLLLVEKGKWQDVSED